MKRKPEESFEEYRERRKKENNWKQRIRIFFTGGTYRRKPEEKIVREKPLITRNRLACIWPANSPLLAKPTPIFITSKKEGKIL